MKPFAKNLITDIPGLLVGNSGDDEIKTGATVITAETPFTASVSVMGGAPGSRETDLLAPDKTVTDIHAIALAGGSAFGLDVAGGVMQGLREAGRGIPVGRNRIPIVPAAIIYDLNNGGAKDWKANPYAALGREAFDTAADDFELGTIGAGTGAIAGNVKGGLGSASTQLGNGIIVAALAVVNSLGLPLVPGQKRFWAAPFEYKNEFGGLGMADTHDAMTEPELPKLSGMNTDRANTTIAVVATNAKLDKAGCQRMATAAHDGMARALVPAHTPFDGDLIFAIATGRDTDTTPPDVMLQMRLGHAAANCLARAIARGVWEATPAPHDPYPTVRET